MCPISIDDWGLVCACGVAVVLKQAGRMRDLRAIAVIGILRRNRPSGRIHNLGNRSHAVGIKIIGCPITINKFEPLNRFSIA